MAEPTKVAHVMRRFVPEKWGGTESVVFSLSRELIRRGTDCTIYCTDMFSRAGADQLENISIKRFHYIFPWFGLSDEAQIQLKLKGGSPLSLPLFLGLLKEKNLSLIHAHVQHRLGGIARTVAKLKGIPYVVSIHGGHLTLPREQIDKMTKPFAGKLEWGKVFGFLFGARRVIADANAVICVGKDEYEQLRKRYPSKKIFYVPNGVNVARFSEANGDAFREAYDFQAHEKIILCVSRIDYQKNQLGLIRAFSKFSKDHPEHRLVLIGAATVEQYREEVTALITEQELEDRVLLIDGLRPDDPLLPSAYRAAEMFVLPTHHEPFGIVVLEAWAAKVPVIAYRVGGLAGFTTHAKNILLIEQDNEQELVQRMTEISADEPLREAITRVAFQEVSSTYDWRVMADKVAKIYEKTTSNS
jgi:glycosyltransferase involved in cell wall biosynthesis